MTACHLIADGNLTFLSDVAAYYFINAGTELVAVFSCKHFDVYYYAVFAVRYAKGSIANLSCLFAEYCAEKSLLGGKLRLALRRYLTDKYIARVNRHRYGLCRFRQGRKERLHRRSGYLS